MKLQLNFNKPGNYAFFCPVSKVHLTRSNPVAFVNEVTPYINRGLKSKAIIEIVETEGQKANVKQEEPVKNEEQATQASTETPVTTDIDTATDTNDAVDTADTEEVKEEKAEKAAPKKRGRSSSNN